jgi:hypothetical protein
MGLSTNTREVYRSRHVSPLDHLTLALTGGADWRGRCPTATGVTGRTVRSSALLGCMHQLRPKHRIAQGIEQDVGGSSAKVRSTLPTNRE